MRNVCFEYEKYEVDFDQFNLLKILVKLLVLEQGISHLPPAWEHLNGLCKKEKFLKQINMDNNREILDAIVLLINTERFLNELHEAKFEELLSILKIPAFGESRTKVDIIAA